VTSDGFISGEALEATERPYVVRGYVQDITERKERSRRYEAMFNQSYQFSGLLEPDGTVIEANQRALDFGGLEREQVIGKPIWELEWWQLDEATQQGVKEAVDRAADGEFVRYEVEVQAGDETAVIDFSIRPITDEDGTVRSLIPEGRDITERTEREEELSALKDRYQTLLDAAPAPVFVANAATGEIVEVNTAAERLVGESREQIVGQRQSKLHPPEKSALYRKAFQEQVRTGQTVSRLADGSRLELRTADGDTVPIEISASTVSLPDGVVIFGIFRDVSKAVEDEP
jgi:PAS domain S-box-containing protein